MPTTVDAPSRRVTKYRTALLVMAFLVPVALFMAVTLAFYRHHQRRAVEESLNSAADGIVQALNAALERPASSLSALALSWDFDHPAEMAARLRPLAEKEGWITVVVTDGQRQIFRLDGPPRSMLDKEGVARTLDSGQPTMSDLLILPDRYAEPVVVVRVPIARNGRNVATLGAVLPANSLSRRIFAGVLPGWVGAIVDRNGIIITRSQNAETYIGTPFAPHAMEAWQSDNSRPVRAETKEGMASYGILRHSSYAGWWVAVAAPRAIVDGPYNLARNVVWGAGGLAAAIGLVLVAWVGNVMRRASRAEVTVAEANAERAQTQRLVSIGQNLPGVIYQRRRTPDGQYSYPFWTGVSSHLFNVPEGADEHARFLAIAGSFAEGDGQAWMEALEESARTLTPFVFEGRAGDRWFRSMSNVRREADGSVVWDGVALDITELRQAHAALQESEDHYRHTVELNPQIPWSATPDGGIETFSDRWLRFTGLTREETVGEGWVRALHPDDLGPTTEAWRRCCATGEPLDIEFRVRDAQEQYRWMRSRAFPQRDAGGAVVRWYGALEDVHDRKQAEEALRASEQRYRFLADAIPQIVWTATPDGSLDFVNARLDEYLCASQPGECSLGWDWEHLLHPDDLADTLAAWKDAIRRRSPFEVEYRLRRRDGAYRWHLVRALPMCDAHGRVVKWFGSTTDIHDRKLQAEALEAARQDAEDARREAEKANLAKSKFLAAASHDLRQPVQSMLLFAHALAAKLRGHPAAPVVEKLMVAQESFKSLLDSLLDISKLDAGLVTPACRPIDVLEVMDELAAAYGARASDKGLTFRLRSCRAWVNTDPTLLSRILSNLLDNALKYTPSGGLRFSCRCAGGRVRFDVVDTGVGIAPEHIHDIFREFVQVGEQGREQKQGMGLGLATVRRLADLLGAELAVSSKPGRGSRFSVSFPASAPVEDEPKAAKHVHSHGEARKRILVVDDEAVILEGMKVLLEGWGYQPVTATSLNAALDTVTTAGRPDALIADYRLGAGVTGPDVIGAVRKRLGEQVPAVLLTGDTGLRSGREFLVLHKPVAPDFLRHTLETLCA